MSEDIPPLLREVLRDIGLGEPDMDVPLHAKLVETLKRLGPGATFGARIVALRFDFNWELEAAGRTFAKAKTDYEVHIDRRTVKLRAEGDKMSRAEAEQIARSEDKAYELKLAYLLAEQRERSMRKFLETLDAALENHRTDRADARAADAYHARTGA